MLAPERQEADKRVIYTYRYLRVCMVALMLIFGAVPLTQLATQWCLLESISGYFYTPARTLFTGSLFGLGACLLAYQGHTDEEDVLLNFSGIMAFVVASVPTSVEDDCAFVPTDAARNLIGIANNLVTLLIIGVSSAVAIVILRRVANATALTRPARILTGVCALVLALEIGAFFFHAVWFYENIHVIAAYTMAGGISGVMFVQALHRPQRPVGGGTEAPKRSAAKLQPQAAQSRSRRSRRAREVEPGRDLLRSDRLVLDPGVSDRIHLLAPDSLRSFHNRV